LIESVFFVVRIVAAKREGPVADRVIDIETGALTLKSIQELDRSTLVVGVAAGVVGGIARPTTEIDVLLPERLRLRDLLDRAVVRPRPELVLEHVAEWISGGGPRKRRTGIDRKCRRCESVDARIV